EEISKPAIGRALGVPVAQEHAVSASRGVKNDLTSFSDQHACARASLARFHVLGKDQELVARGLDDRVEIAAQNERGGLKRLFVGDLDDINAREGELLELELRVGRFVPSVARDGG